MVHTAASPGAQLPLTRFDSPPRPTFLFKTIVWFIINRRSFVICALHNLIKHSNGSHRCPAELGNQSDGDSVALNTAQLPLPSYLPKRMRLTSQKHSVLLGTGTKVPQQSHKDCLPPGISVLVFTTEVAQGVKLIYQQLTTSIVCGN